MAGITESRSVSRTALIVVVVGALLSTPVSAPIPVLPQIAAQFPDYPAMAQLVMTVPALGMLMGALVSDVAMRRLALRPLLAAALIAYALSGALPLVQSSAVGLLAGRLVVGVASALASAVTLGWLAMAHDEVQRARLIGFQSAGAVASAVLAVPIAGMLAEQGGWRAPFWLYVAMLACLPLLLFVRLDAVSPSQPAPTSPSVSIWNLWPVLGALAVLACFIMMATLAMPFRLNELGIRSPESISWWSTLAALPAIAGSAVFGAAHARFRGARLHLVVLGTMGLGYLGTGLAPTLGWLVAAAALANIGVGMQGPYMSNILFSRAVPEQYGGAAAMVGPAFFAGQFACGPLGAAAQAAVGVRGTFVVLGVVMLIITSIIVLRSAHRAREVSGGELRQRGP